MQSEFVFKYIKHLNEYYEAYENSFGVWSDYPLDIRKPYFVYSKFLWIPKKIKIGESFGEESQELFEIRWLSRELISCEVDFYKYYPNKPSIFIRLKRWVFREKIINLDEVVKEYDKRRVITIDKYFYDKSSNEEMIESYNRYSK